MRKLISQRVGEKKKDREREGQPPTSLLNDERGRQGWSLNDTEKEEGIVGD